MIALGGFDGFFLSSAVESIALPLAPQQRGSEPVESCARSQVQDHHHEKVGACRGGEDVGGDQEDEEEDEETWRGGEWVREGSMLEARNGFGACVVGGQIWVAGGNKGFECLSSTEAYDHSRGTWVAGPEMQEARHWHAVAAVPGNGRMYATGGWATEIVQEWDGQKGVYEDAVQENARLLTHVESLDPREGKWRTEAPMR
jgi:hypothetical protein